MTNEVRPASMDRLSVGRRDCIAALDAILGAIVDRLVADGRAILDDEVIHLKGGRS